MLMMRLTWGEELWAQPDQEPLAKEEVNLKAVSSSSSSNGEEDVLFEINIRDLQDGEGASVSPTSENSGELIPTGGDWYPVATRVFKAFQSEWKVGFVDSYDADTSTYAIQYEDGQEETYPLGSAELASIVSNAEHYVPYDEGTVVYRKAQDEFGTIIYFYNWVYTVKWDKEGDYQNFHEISKVMHLVEAALIVEQEGVVRPTPPTETPTVPPPPQQQDLQGKKHTNWKIFLILPLLVGIGLTIYTVKKRQVNNNDKRFRRAELIAQQYKDRNRNLQGSYEDEDLELAATTLT